MPSPTSWANLRQESQSRTALFCSIWSPHQTSTGRSANVSVHRLTHRRLVSRWAFSAWQRRTRHAPRPQLADHGLAKLVMSLFKACCVRLVDASQDGPRPPVDAPLACVCLTKYDKTVSVRKRGKKGTRLAQPQSVGCYCLSSSCAKVLGHCAGHQHKSAYRYGRDRRCPAWSIRAQLRNKNTPAGPQKTDRQLPPPCFSPPISTNVALYPSTWCTKPLRVNT